MHRTLTVEVGRNGCKMLLEGRETYYDSGTADLETALRDFLQKSSQKRKPHKTYLILSSEKAVLRFVSMPALSKKILNKEIVFFYDNLFLNPNVHYSWDYRVIQTAKGKADLLLAALPTSIISDITAVFRRLKIRLHGIDLIENAVGNMLLFEKQAVVFIKQESTIRVVRPLQNSWRISDTFPESVRELRASFAGLDGTEQICRCVFYGPADDCLLTECKNLEIAELDPIEPYAALGHYANSISGRLNLLQL